MATMTLLIAQKGEGKREGWGEGEREEREEGGDKKEKGREKEAME